MIAGLKEQIITMMGQQDSMSLMRTSYTATIIWTMFFIIFFAYFFVTASIVAFEDGFDDTVIERGYPSDFEKASRWTWQEYIVWMCSWMPEVGMDKRYEEICKSFKVGEDDLDNESDDENQGDESQQNNHRPYIFRINDRYLYVPEFKLCPQRSKK